MTPIDWAAVGTALTGIGTMAVKWLIPGIRQLLHPAHQNGDRHYRQALEDMTTGLGELRTSIAESREEIAGMQPRLDTASEEIRRLRDAVETMPRDIAEAIDRRVGPLERRVETTEKRIGYIERRDGLTDRRGHS